MIKSRAMRQRRAQMFDPPVDFARRLQRERERFLERCHFNLSAWQLARLVSRTASIEDWDGWDGAEGLRGLWMPASDGEPDRIVWWPARAASHYQGSIFLGARCGPDDTIARVRIYEIEINVSTDRHLFLMWSMGGEEIAEKVMKHPSLRDSFHDGDLVAHGRYLVVRPGKVLFGEPIPTD